MQDYGIDKQKDLYLNIAEEELKGESAGTDRRRTETGRVIPERERRKKWYFWYFTDLQSDKEGMN